MNCAATGCDTVLSGYNPSTLCHAHAARVLQPLLRWLSPKPWHARARCLKYGGLRQSPFDVEPFSAQRDDPLTSKTVRIAKTLCAGCPVRRECLEDALVHHTTQGIWGGTMPKEREGKSVADLEALLDEMTRQAQDHGLAPKEAA